MDFSHSTAIMFLLIVALLCASRKCESFNQHHIFFDYGTAWNGLWQQLISIYIDIRSTIFSTFSAHQVKCQQQPQQQQQPQIQQQNDAVLTISTHDAVVIMSETQKFVIQLK